MALEDNDLFPYGKYKKEGLTMEEVPAWYLLSQRNYFRNKTITPNSPVDDVVKYVDENEDILLKEQDESR